MILFFSWLPQYESDVDRGLGKPPGLMNPAEKQLGWDTVALGLGCLVLVRRELGLACEGHNSESFPRVSVSLIPRRLLARGQSRVKGCQGSAEAGALTHVSSKVHSQLQRARSPYMTRHIQG